MASNQFFIKFTKKGRTYYVDGAKYQSKRVWSFVSKDKVQKAKKRVVDYSLIEHKVKEPKKIDVQKTTSENFGQKIIDSDILSQSINKSILLNKNKKVGIKYKNQIYQINLDTPEKIKALTELTDKIQSNYFNTFKGLIDSPLLFIGFVEGVNGVVINYDSTMLGEDGELNEEFPKEYKKFRQANGRLLTKFLKNGNN